MSTLAAHAYGFAATFRLKELLPALAGAEIYQDQDRDRVLATFPGESRVAILYDFGALVCFGLEAAERERLVQAVLGLLAPEPHAPLTEDFLVEVRQGAGIEVQFERVILPDVTVPLLDIIGLLLAQSVAMDYYEEDVQEILGRSQNIIQGLQGEGRIPGRVADLVRFIGSCMATKNAVISALALFDKPDSTWESRDLDRLYTLLRHELELDDRFRALEAKLRMIQENLVLLVDLTQGRSTWRLEMTVVMLILIEVVIMLWQIARGGGH